MRCRSAGVANILHGCSSSIFWIKKLTSGVACLRSAAARCRSARACRKSASLRRFISISCRALSDLSDILEEGRSEQCHGSLEVYFLKRNQARDPLNLRDEALSRRGLRRWNQMILNH